MRRFILNLLLYLLPLAIYAAVGFGLPAYVGEYTSLAQVAEAQAGPQPVLFGRAYYDNFFSYKLISTRQRAPELLALGSSRVMQFRSYLVQPGAGTFYNAGGAAASVFDLRLFINGLSPAQSPRVLIVGLDQDWFQPDIAAQQQTSQTPFDPETTHDEWFLLNNSRSAVADVISGHWSMLSVLPRRDPLTHVRAIGIAASATGDGFRNDGSRQYGKLLLNPGTTADRLADARQRIAAGDLRFNYADTFSDAAVAELNRFLDQCAARGIQVIGFSPPYAPSIYAEMQASGHYGYISALAGQLQQVFVAHGFAYFDFSRGQLPGVGDDDFLDGFHGSERVYTQLYLQMLLAQPAVLGHFSSPATLAAKLSQPRQSPFQVWPDT